MKYFLALLFCLTLFVSCKKDSKDVSIFCLYEKIIADYEKENFEKEGNPVINYVLVDASFNPGMLSSVLSVNNKIITKSDIDTLQRQIGDREFDIVDKRCITSKIILTSNKLNGWYKLGYEGFWKEFESVYGKSGYYRFSKPLFTKDRKRLIVLFENTYFKMTPIGTFYIYVRKNDQWVLENNSVTYF